MELGDKKRDEFVGAIESNMIGVLAHSFLEILTPLAGDVVRYIENKKFLCILYGGAKEIIHIDVSANTM